MNDLDKYQVWTALVTPFKDDGSIDYDSFKVVIENQQKAGNAILALGSTGEALALTSDEKKQVVKFIDHLKLKIPVMIGVGGFDLKQQQEWIDFCNKQKCVSCFLLVTPIYAKPALAGQISWFHNLLDKAQRPCMLYNIPSRAGVALDPAALDALQDHKNLWALKDSSGDLTAFHNFRMAAPPIALYCGNDDMMPHCALMGASGIVSASANVWPEAIKLYVEKSINRTGILFPIWRIALDALSQVSNPIPVKALLFEKKVIKTSKVRAPLSQADLKDVECLLEADQLIAKWLKLPNELPL